MMKAGMGFFGKRLAIAAKAKGAAKAFAYAEMACLPLSVATFAIVAVQSFAALAGFRSLAAAAPEWFMAVALPAAVGYLTNYIAIQMLYYPVAPSSLSGTEGRLREARLKSRAIRIATFGFWQEGLFPVHPFRTNGWHWAPEDGLSRSARCTWHRERSGPRKWLSVQ